MNKTQTSLNTVAVAVTATTLLAGGVKLKRLDSGNLSTSDIGFKAVKTWVADWQRPLRWTSTRHLATARPWPPAYGIPSDAGHAGPAHRRTRALMPGQFRRQSRNS